MLNGFEEKVGGFIDSEGLLDGGGGVLLAVSGGADSAAVAGVFAALRDEGVINCRLIGGHVNHNLRGELGDSDQAFSKELCERLGVEFFCRSVDVKGFAEREKVSIETAGRLLRMGALIEMAKEQGCSAVATGHHADDNAETIVHRLLRGTGFRGLGGIWPKREFEGVRFVRPLLCVRRREIVEYCRSKGISWREDHTNRELCYTRNRIRHLLMGELEKEFACGGFVDVLNGLASESRRLQLRIEKAAGDVWGEVCAESGSGGVEFFKDVFAGQANFVQIELIRRALLIIGCGERDIGEYQYEGIVELGKGGSGRKVELGGGFEVRSGREKMFFGRAGKESAFRDEGAVELLVGGEVEFGGYRIRAEILGAGECDVEEFKRRKDGFVEWFDLDKLKMPVFARRRKDGDRFLPFGISGEKRVGKFLTSVRVGDELAGREFVICDGERIIWVCPVRLGRGAEIGSETRRVLQVSLSEL